jgi:hypothetical protein
MKIRNCFFAIRHSVDTALVCAGGKSLKRQVEVGGTVVN